MAQPSAASSRSLHVTCVEIGVNAFHIVARCDACDIVAERRVDDWSEGDILDVMGIEALAMRGCKHVDEVVSTGARRAFERR